MLLRIFIKLLHRHILNQCDRQVNVEEKIIPRLDHISSVCQTNRGQKQKGDEHKLTIKKYSKWYRKIWNLDNTTWGKSQILNNLVSCRISRDHWAALWCFINPVKSFKRFIKIIQTFPQVSEKNVSQKCQHVDNNGLCRPAAVLVFVLWPENLPLASWSSIHL